MDVLKRAVRNSQSKAKREKIPEGWGDNKEPVSEGVTFFLKYIGSTLVEEIESDATYGDGISSKAVHNIILMAKSAGKKLRKTAVTVSSQGILMVDMTTNELMFDLSIYRISFCTADKDHDKVFAYIARNTTNETMECHSFLCPKSKIAQAVTLTVSQAFSIAQDRWIENKRLKKSIKEKARHEKNTSNNKTNVPKSNINSSSLTPIIPLAPIDISPSKLSDSSPKKISEEKDSRQNWQSFDDSDSDIDDLFSRLAENRIKRLPSFSTNLKADEVDVSVQQYMDEKLCFEAFSRTKSVDDLLNL